MTTTMLKVEGMRCDGCAQSVRERLLAVPGVSNADVDLKQAQATVQHDPRRANAAALVKAVEAGGFSAAVGTGK